MAEKISQYVADATSNPIKNEDLLDFSNEDGGGGYDVSKKIKVSEFLTFLNANGQNIYVANGTLTEDREVTAATFHTRWTGGDIVVRMDNEIDNYGFIIQDSSSTQKGVYGYDQSTVSAYISLSNASGEYFNANNGEMTVNTDVLFVNGDSVGIGTATPGALNRVHIVSANALQTNWQIYTENSDNDVMFEVRNNGEIIMGLARDTSGDFTVGSGDKIVNVVGDSSGSVIITNATQDGVTPNTTAQNMSLNFTTRNSLGNMVTVLPIFVRNRNVTAGSEYGVMIISDAIQTENSTGTDGRTVISSRNRHTSGAALSVLMVENRENNTTTTFQVDQFSQNTGLSLGVRSGSAGTSANTWNWRLKNNHEFEHNFGQLATGDFIMRSQGNAQMFFMNAGNNAVGIGKDAASGYMFDVDGVIGVKTYTVAGLPAVPATGTGLIAVSDESGGYTLAFSDGTNWRRCTDLAIVS